LKGRRFHFALLIGIAVGIGVTYIPTFLSAFNGDDFDYLRILVFNSQGLVNGDPVAWDEWFRRSITGYVYLRPFVSVLALVDFIMGNVAPFGYHFVGVLIHILATFTVYWTARHLLRDQFAAVLAALIFAVLPIHMSAVAWFAARNDVLCALWSFLALFFFIRYRRDGARSNYLWSLVLLALAFFSKELSVTIPAALLLYDVLYHPCDLFHVPALVRRHAPYWILLAAYFVTRLLVLGKIAARGVEYLGEGWWGWIDALIRYSFFPLVSDVTPELRWLMLAIVLVLLIASRAHRGILFGLAWIPLTYFLTISTNPSDYSFYLPSYGVALVAGWLLSRACVFRFEIPLRVRATLVAMLLIVLAVVTFQWSQAYRRATDVAAAIVQQVKTYYPTLAPDARLAFVGVPDRTTDDVIVFLAGFGSAVQIAYLDPTLQVQRFTQFPLWIAKPDRTFFFLVDHRRVSKRDDIARALDARRKCAGMQTPRIAWNFSIDAQGWEAWSELQDLRAREGALTMRATGSDPNLGSPMINVPALNFGDIELTMRVRAEQPNLQGQIYWQAQDQKDFTPDLYQTFAVQADGVWRTYRVNLAATDKLFIGDSIVRLRIDPVNAPAEIEIQSIRILTVCVTAEGACECNQ
jgi:hypothetical protein